MKFKYTLSFLPLALALGAIARADDWRHDCLRSAGGAEIAVDFRTTYVDHNDVGGPAGTLAAETWINVTGGDLPLNGRADVELDTYAYDRRLGNQVTDLVRQVATRVSSQTFSLMPADPRINRWTARVDGILQVTDTSSEYPGSAYFQTLAISTTSNGCSRAFVNPADGTTTFQFQMADASTAGCQ